MTDLRFFFIPGVLLALVVGYVALNPAGAAVEPVATETPLPSPTRTETAPLTNTPPPTATPFPGELQLSGLSGTLTYQSTSLVSVEFPSGAWVEPPALDDHDSSASDGAEWRYETSCRDDNTSCVISFRARDGRQAVLKQTYDAPSMRWRPGTRTLAISSTIWPAARITIVDDASDPRPRVAYDAGSGTILAFEWYGERLLIAHSDGIGTEIRVAQAGGVSRTVATVATAVSHFHASPDTHTFAFTASDPAGWRLYTIDAYTDAVTDRGAMGSDGPDGVPVPEPPDGGKGAMYISWSPDGSRLAFGGGSEPPYIMTVVDLATGGVARTEFPSGYPGEMRWSPDGTQLAVSTYDVERTHHETWVVDPATGAGTHLMDGCIIVWSPDSRFLAVHGEDVPGIAIINTITGARMQLTANRDDAPLRWTE
jgi:Tol biopolymer transport system component